MNTQDSSPHFVQLELDLSGLLPGSYLTSEEMAKIHAGPFSVALELEKDTPLSNRIKAALKLLSLRISQDQPLTEHSSKTKSNHTPS